MHGNAVVRERMIKMTYEFRNLPNFNRVLRQLGVENTGKLLNTIERIRYMIYVMSYFENECVEIDEVNYTIDKKYLDQILQKFVVGESFVNIVVGVQTAIQQDLQEMFGAKLALFCKNAQYNCDSVDKAFNDVIDNRTVEWDVFCSYFYDDIENPTVVEELLDKLFENNSMEVKYKFEMYDLGDYTVGFVSESDLTDFVINFVNTGSSYVDTGTAYEKDTAGNWREMWTVS